MPRPEFSDQRGQSEIIGAILLIAIVLLTISAAAFGGLGGFQSAKTGVDIKIVEQDMNRLSGAVYDVAFGNAEVRTVGLNLQTADKEGSTLVKPQSGRIELSVGGMIVHQGYFGMIEYENEQTYVAYQGGGVWRKGTNGASMVDAPEFSNNDHSTPTLTIPIISVNGNATLDSGATVMSGTEFEKYSPLKIATDETATITIQSRYYAAWARYFTDNLNIPESGVSTTPETQTVTVTYGEGTEAYLHVTMYQVTVDEN